MRRGLFVVEMHRPTRIWQRAWGIYLSRRFPWIHLDSSRCVAILWSSGLACCQARQDAPAPVPHLSKKEKPMSYAFEATGKKEKP